MIRQLYYTSVLDGPGGLSGFQFCARSDGIDEDVLRLVERLTVYEKPRDISSDADISAFPVNLIYHSALSPSGLKLLAQVKFTGEDFSQRPGNYFAHSLIIDDLVKDLSGFLPAEMWEAPVWRSEPGPTANLPVLGPLVARGVQTRVRLHDDLVRTEGFTQRLAMLADAADAAVSGGRQVLLVGPSSLAVWQWIMAASYLLGPQIAQRMSFCTYAHDPARARTHVVGVVSSRELDVRLRTGFALFDLRVRDPEAVGGDAPMGEGLACATMLANAGLVVAARAWELAASIFRPSTETLASWYPILACALMGIEWELADADLAAAVAWLGAHRIDPRSRGPILTGSLCQRLGSLSPSGQSALVDSALLLEAEPGSQDKDIAGRIEALIARQSLGLVSAYKPDVEVTRLRTRPGQEAAKTECDRLLRESDVRRALSVLQWASLAGVAPGEGLVRKLGRETIAQALVEELDPDDARPAAQQWPALRAGMVEQLAGLPDVLLTRMARPFGDLIEPSDFAGAFKVGERWLAIRARSRGTSPVEQFIEVCELRRAANQPDVIDDALLMRLWPGGRWEPAEALAVADAFPPDELLRSPAARMMADTFLAGPSSDHAQRSSWANLADHLAGWPAKDQSLFGVSMAGTVKTMRTIIWNVNHGADDAHIAIMSLAARYESAPTLARYYLSVEVPYLILMKHPNLCSALASCPKAMMQITCDTALDCLYEQPRDTDLAARLYVCRNRLIGLKDKRAGLQVETMILAPMAREWTRREIVAIAKRADAMGDAGRDFEKWINKYRKRGRLRLFG
jgi:hypothetical protein